MNVCTVCAHSLIEILKRLNPKPHLMHTRSLHTYARHTLPAAISPCCWMPLIPVPYLLRWETGDRSNLSQRNLPSLSLSLHRQLSLPFPSLRHHSYSADPGKWNKERWRRIGSGRWIWEGGRVCVGDFKFSPSSSCCTGMTNHFTLGQMAWIHKYK